MKHRRDWFADVVDGLVILIVLSLFLVAGYVMIWL